MNKGTLLSLPHLAVAEEVEGKYIHLKCEDGYVLAVYSESENILNYMATTEVFLPIVESYPEYSVITTSENITHRRDNEYAISHEEAVAEALETIASVDDIDVISAAYDAIPKKINMLSISNSDALRRKKFYPDWENDKDVVKGERYNDGEHLYEVLQSHHTQENWRPSVYTASLWKVVDEDHEGTKEDPIPYNVDFDPLFPGMELHQGKYYIQDKIYLCTRDSGTALIHNLSTLVGHYVELT